MNPLIELKKTAPLLLITLTLHCFALLPQAQAVVPPPDGGYPGFNTAEGQNALLSLTTGAANTAVGWFSLSSDTTGSFNTATGAGTLLFNTGDQNTAFGAAALLFNGTGTRNTAVGVTALLNNTTGEDNTANGVQALSSNTTGIRNTAVGDFALANNISGGGNTALGFGAGFGVTMANNVICIGANGANVNNSCYIGYIYGTFNTAESAVVYIDPDGRLGTGPSARRFKKDIADMGAASEVLLSMRPVTFPFKTQDTEKAGREISQFGLIAEEVAEVNPDLILRDKEGEIYSVRYDAVNAMLLNEFQKAHRRVEAQQGKIEGQEATISQLQSTLTQQQKRFESKLAQQEQQIAGLTADFQRLVADIELNKTEAGAVAEK